MVWIVIGFGKNFDWFVIDPYNGFWFDGLLNRSLGRPAGLRVIFVLTLHKQEAIQAYQTQ